MTVPCAACGHVQDRADTAANVDRLWRPIGDERVCRDYVACSERHVTAVLAAGAAARAVQPPGLVALVNAGQPAGDAADEDDDERERVA